MSQSTTNVVPTGSQRTRAFNPSTDIPSLAGKVILITGANSGIGRQTALELSKHSPAQIWLAARNISSCAIAVDEVKEACGSEVDVRASHCDLTSFASIRSAAELVTAGAKRLDIRCLNTGILGGPAGTTSSGHEIQFSTNHIGHALLLNMLLPLLLKTSKQAEEEGQKPRVIFTTSRRHAMALPAGGIAFVTLKTPQLDTPPLSRYTRSKLANILYARQFALRYPSIVSVAMHPGEVATRLFSKGAVGGDPQIEYLAREVAPKMCVGVQEGVQNGFWAATAEGVESGRYYEPVGVGAEVMGVDGGGD